MDDFVIVDKKKLRRGYTTGTCAAAAAQAAAARALGGTQLNTAEIATPKGVLLNLHVEHDSYNEKSLAAGALKACRATCHVIKDSGDDPDVTNGISIFATVATLPDEPQPPHSSGKSEPFNAECCSELTKALLKEHPGATITQGDGITILMDGGVGVGRVTKAGLACQIGQAAINPVPRKMIEEEVRRVAEALDYAGILFVEISIPEGVSIAKRTYNPRLGIEGGISVLGTSGIVEPMSEQALIDTIKVEMNMRCAEGAEFLLLTPGNYGETFLKETMKLGNIYTVKCSNFLGEALDYAEEKGLKGILLVSHIGKLVKVAAGIMNTHSRYGDARLEVLAAHGALQGATQKTVEELMQSVTTDDGIAALDRAGLRQQTLESVLSRVQYHLEERTHHTMKVGAVMFSNQYGYLGQTATAEELIHLL